MKIKEQIEELNSDGRIEKVFQYGFVATQLNYFREAVEELDDDDAMGKFEDLFDYVIDKRVELADEEI